MSRRMAVTLSCGDNGALGPPISVLRPRGAKSIAALRITHIHGCLGAAIGYGAARRIVGERAHPTRNGDHQPSHTTSNVISIGLKRPQGPHRVHIEHLGPGFVIDIASPLSGPIAHRVLLRRQQAETDPAWYSSTMDLSNTPDNPSKRNCCCGPSQK